MKVLISLPVYQRAWILPLWFAMIEQQDIDLSDVGFSFQVASYEEDKATHDVLFDWFTQHPEVACFVLNEINDLDHQHHEDGHRRWDIGAYDKMCAMRNALLDTAESLNPDYLFSLDSDILLENPSTISGLIELTQPGTAVSPLMYMKHYGINYPSVMTWENVPGGRASRVMRRYKIGQTFKSDVIMAAVMMSKEVYTTARYFPHKQGEDVGWSADCAKHGFKLFSASQYYCPHIMHQSSANVKGIKGPGILDIYLNEGDDRKCISVD